MSQTEIFMLYKVCNRMTIFSLQEMEKKDKLSQQDCHRSYILLCSDLALISDSAQNTVMLNNDLKHSR